MRTISFVAILLASALSVAGCGGGAAPANNGAAAPAKPAETNAPAPAPAPAGNEAAEGEEGESTTPSATVDTARQNFSVVNATGHVVVTLNVSPASENDWGPDILGTDVLLQSGQTAQVVFDRAETQCVYDIRATYDDGDADEMRGVNLCQTATVRLTAE